MYPMYGEQAARFCAAVKYLAEHENALENLECYLMHCFGGWLGNYAADPDSLSAELERFAHIYD